MYWLCYCVASCNRYLMLINHPTDGATDVEGLIRSKKKKKIFYFVDKKFVERTVR